MLTLSAQSIDFTLFTHNGVSNEAHTTARILSAEMVLRTCKFLSRLLYILPLLFYQIQDLSEPSLEVSFPVSGSSPAICGLVSAHVSWPSSVGEWLNW